MNTESNRKIAGWLGWENRSHTQNDCWYIGNTFQCYYLPNWCGDDKAAITLLPVLIDRMCEYSLAGWNNDGMQVHTFTIDDGSRDNPYGFGDSIHMAISTAILILIDGCHK